MRNLLIVLFAAFLVQCNSTSDKKTIDTKDTTRKDTNKIQPPTDTTTKMTEVKSSDTSINDKFEDALMKLPLVIKANAHIDSFSHHKHG
ncbi:MAG TPA: hypothetical protein VKH37_12980, partial [Ferruginibacter sp.]|nr:hypothetical protein [Ferruginibacter sp.]